ncbi:MAG: hypothetical protein COA44_04920 [Arcobacter sp.]|nr:MAG: hypothetical protein COA44_04920 [Arcobacter sp.]
MNEPRLQDSTDYHKLTGAKREVVWALVSFLLALGVMYSIVKVSNSQVSGEIPLGKRVDYTK